MSEKPEEIKHSRTFGEHIRQGLREAHARRPASFYMLLSIPVVLLLCVHLFRDPENFRRLALGMTALFIFLGVIGARAVMDVIEISRKHLAERRSSFRDLMPSPDEPPGEPPVIKEPIE